MLAQATELTQASGEGWFVTGASVIGTSHLADEKPCQDAHAVRMLAGGGLVAAVSDGAGSAEMSDVGSRVAVEEAITAIARGIAERAPANDEEWSALLRHGFATAAEALGRTATERSVAVRQLSATLLVGVVHPRRSVIATVGDCVAVVREATGGWQLPVKPARGEYANETTFLTSTGWAQSLQIEFLAETPDRVALFSDGLMRLALNLAAGTPHAPFFDSLCAFLTSRANLGATLDALREFLDSERVNARTDDDKTLVLAWRDGAATSVAR
jgi:hypothetical protein